MLLETAKTMLSDAITAFELATPEALQAAAQNVFTLQAECTAAAARETAQDDRVAA